MLQPPVGLDNQDAGVEGCQPWWAETDTRQGEAALQLHGNHPADEGLAGQCSQQRLPLVMLHDLGGELRVAEALGEEDVPGLVTVGGRRQPGVSRQPAELGRSPGSPETLELGHHVDEL